MREEREKENKERKEGKEIINDGCQERVVQQPVTLLGGKMGGVLGKDYFQSFTDEMSIYLLPI